MIKQVQSIYKSHEKQTASDLAYVAAKNLLKEKDIDPNSIEALILVTQTPDYRLPATACVLAIQARSARRVYLF